MGKNPRVLITLLSLQGIDYARISFCAPSILEVLWSSSRSNPVEPKRIMYFGLQPWYENFIELLGGMRTAKSIPPSG